MQISHRKVSVELLQSIDLYSDTMKSRPIDTYQNTYHLPQSQHIRGRLQSSGTLCDGRGTVHGSQEQHSKPKPKSYFRHVDIDSTTCISTAPKKETKKKKKLDPQCPLLVVEQEPSQHFAKFGLINLDQ
jgi:hypothetical protein